MQILVGIGIALMGLGAVTAGLAAIWSARAVVMLREENEALKGFIKEMVREQGGISAVMERRINAHTKGKVQ